VISEQCVEGDLIVKFGFFTSFDPVKSPSEFLVVREKVVWGQFVGSEVFFSFPLEPFDPVRNELAIFIW
jgi:hypothetical protein